MKHQIAFYTRGVFAGLLCYVSFAHLSAAMPVDRVAPAAATHTALDGLVGTVLNESEDVSFQSRMAAAHSLSNDLSTAEVDALLVGVVRSNRSKDLSAAQWAALFNDVLNVLGTQQILPDGYTEELLSIVEYQSSDLVLRDYALQHLLALLEQRMEEGERKVLLARLDALTETERQTSLSGTYLLGVFRQADQPGYPKKSELGKLALDLAQDTSAFMPNRITAIQVCGKLEFKDSLHFACALAQNSSEDTGLRMAAIATVADLGNYEQLLQLRKIKYAGSPDARILYALSAAEKRLSK